jgi:O-antigen ligase
MSLSVLFSLSRGGMISIAAGIVFVGIFGVQMALQRRRAWEMEEWGDDDEPMTRRRRRILAWLPQTAAVAAIVMSIVIGLLWLGPDSVASRLAQGELTGGGQSGQNFYGSRGWIWRDTWTMIAARPLLGAGLGAYRTAFPIYTQSDGFYLVHQSHNDYLQILADAGVVGGALAVWFLVSVFGAFGRGIGARDPWSAALALGGGAALFSLLVHSIFDFNLQLPGTALLFLVLAAVVSQIGERARKAKVGTELEVAAARGEVTQWR